MTERMTRSRRALPRAVMLAVGVALVPWSAAASGAAADSHPAQTAPAAVASNVQNLQQTMAGIVARDLRAGRSMTGTRMEQGSPARQSPAFFKTRAGVVIAAVMIAGTGYALYSSSHDRIHSAGKE